MLDWEILASAGRLLNDYQNRHGGANCGAPPPHVRYEKWRASEIGKLKLNIDG